MLTQVRDVARTMYSSVKPTVATGCVIHSARCHQQRDTGHNLSSSSFFEEDGLARLLLTIICLVRCWLGNLDDPDLTITTQDGKQSNFRLVMRRDGTPL